MRISDWSSDGCCSDLWLAGISIGAPNAAVIAGSPESQRVERLGEFWETICAVPVDWSVNEGIAGNLPFVFDLRPARNTVAAFRALLVGQRGFFKPRFPPPFLSPFSGDAATSFYDTDPLRETLEQNGRESCRERGCQYV